METKENIVDKLDGIKALVLLVAERVVKARYDKSGDFNGQILFFDDVSAFCKLPFTVAITTKDLPDITDDKRYQLMHEITQVVIDKEGYEGILTVQPASGLTAEDEVVECIVFYYEDAECSFIFSRRFELIDNKLVYNGKFDVCDKDAILPDMTLHGFSFHNITNEVKVMHAA